MRADIGILCALREHLSFLASVTTPLVNYDGCQFVDYQGTLLGVALQGRTSTLSYQSARKLIRVVQPCVMCTVGPGALVTADAALGQWYEATRCAWFDLCGVGGELPNPAHGLRSDCWRCANLLVSAESFVADTTCTRRLAYSQGDAVTLLDMTGYGVARACAEAGVPWRHYRWTTDRANDTAVSQFTWNVRRLAKRGNEVVRILEEVLNEFYAVV